MKNENLEINFDEFIEVLKANKGQDPVQTAKDWAEGKLNDAPMGPGGPGGGLASKGIYMLCEDITVESCTRASQWILEENFKEDEERQERLLLIVNSPGGDVAGSFMLTDIMAGSQIPVHTMALGMAASCGLLISMAGAHRMVSPNCSILSHQFAWGSHGKQHELVAVTKEFNLTGGRIVNHYKKHTKLSEKKILKELLCPTDTWLSAEEAVKYNLYDEVKTLGA